MIDPLASLKSEIGDIEKRVRVGVETAILREQAVFILSRLTWLDEDRKESYKSALAALGE